MRNHNLLMQETSKLGIKSGEYRVLAPSSGLLPLALSIVLDIFWHVTPFQWILKRLPVTIAVYHPDMEVTNIFNWNYFMMQTMLD